MRFYPTADIHHYWEYPSGWSLYCHTPNKSWHREPMQKEHTIQHWRDIEGAKKPMITDNDLYFDDWPTERIRLGYCLPMYYAVGNRFIVLEKEFPAGFKCKTLPLNLQEMREIRAYEKLMAKKKAAEEKAAKKLELKQKKQAKKKR